MTRGVSYMQTTVAFRRAFSRPLSDPCAVPYSSRLAIDDLGSRLEYLEFACQQGVDPGLMAAAGIGQTVDDRLFEQPTSDSTVHVQQSGG